MKGNKGSNAESSFSSNIRLISTTDLSGRIPYANEHFVEVSGYSLEELIGQNHILVRYPYMPAKAFADLWQHLKSDKPWMGVVKNRCKNGDYYWVRAYVTALYGSNGQKIGYQSELACLTQQSSEQKKSMLISMGKNVLFHYLEQAFPTKHCSLSFSL